MILVPTPEIVPFALGGIVGAVAGDDGLLPQQAATLGAMGRVFTGDAVDVAAVAPCSPTEVAAGITDPAQRQQLIQAMVVLAFLEHPPSEVRLANIRRYAEALDVDEGAVKVFGDYTHDHTKRMLLDTMRHMPLADLERDFAKEEGYDVVAKSLLAVLGKGSSPKLAAKFERLESCPEGSVGRKVLEMYQDNGWPFPGQPHGVPEATTVHDWVHVLAGYAPTPKGEVQVNAFISACSPDPRLFGTVILALGLYEAGAFKLPIFPHAPEGGVMEQPGAAEGLADAIRRGLATNTDVMFGIDHWAIADEPVAELRERYNIVPKDEPAPTADPGA